MAEPSFGLTGETRRADHQKSAPQEKPLPSTVTSPRGNHGQYHGRGEGNSNDGGKSGKG